MQGHKGHKERGKIRRKKAAQTEGKTRKQI